MILVIGKPDEWAALARVLPEGEILRFVGIEGLAAAVAELCPDLVLCALVGEGFDAVEVAGRLAARKFGGRFLVVTLPLRNAQAVRAEVEEAAGEVDVQLVILGARPN